MVVVEEGGGEGVVGSEAEAVGADVGFCVGGVGEEGGGYVVGDGGGVGEETVEFFEVRNEKSQYGWRREDRRKEGGI